MKKINIDCGHGSQTAGKRTPPFPAACYGTFFQPKAGEQIHEHAYSAAIASLLEKELLGCGFCVHKTAWDDNNGMNDTDVSLTERKRQVKAAGCDASVSIHLNASNSKNIWDSATGISTFYHINPGSRRDSLLLAEDILEEASKAVSAKKRGAYARDLSLCNASDMNVTAAVLIECGFMTNLNDARNLCNTDYLQSIASGIAKGLCRYFQVPYYSQEDSHASSHGTDGTSSGQTAVTESPASYSAVVSSLDGFLNLRTAPNTSGSILYEIPSGTVLSVSRTCSNGWVYVSCHTDSAVLHGYVNAFYLKPLSYAAVSTNGARLMLRAKPGITAAILDRMPNQERVLILKENVKSGWHQVQYHGKTGYASSKYLKI